MLGEGVRGGASLRGVPGGESADGCRAVEGVPAPSLLCVSLVFLRRFELDLARCRRIKGSSVMVRGLGGSKRAMSIFSTKLIF